MINRWIESKINKRLFEGKAIIIMGARQTGKTSLLKKILSTKSNVLWLNGDDPAIQNLLDDVTLVRWKNIIGRSKIVVIDEAQRIKNIGLKLKLVTDQLPAVQLIATGSSSFELASKINEPLTGRKWEYQLFPLSFKEMVDHHGWLEEYNQLHNRLIYGYYPEIVTTEYDKKEVLLQLSDSYLYKDILMWQNINKPEKLTQLLQALAYQLGNEVSYSELGQIVDLDNETVASYIQLLEKSFVIFRLSPFSRNLRKELKRKRKIYFYDNGMRNAVISQFQPLELRQDKGALWENFLISERKKYLSYNNIHGNSYFWRTQDQQVIDYIEDRDGMLYAFEFKWNKKAKVKFSKTFTNAYPNHQTQGINMDNFSHFLGVD